MLHNKLKITNTNCFIFFYILEVILCLKAIRRLLTFFALAFFKSQTLKLGPQLETGKIHVLRYAFLTSILSTLTTRDLRYLPLSKKGKITFDSGLTEYDVFFFCNTFLIMNLEGKSHIKHLHYHGHEKDLHGSLYLLSKLHITTLLFYKSVCY